MAEEKSKAGTVFGVSAMILSAISLARSTRKAKAASGDEGATVTLDPAIQELLEAIAAGTAAGIDDLDSIEKAIREFQFPTEGGGIGVVPNADYFTSGRMQVTALNRARQLPPLEIPDDMEIVFKGWPFNGGIIYLACTDPASRNIESIWPLIANETIGYRIKNLNVAYFTGTRVGDWLGWTVEQRGKAR